MAQGAIFSGCLVSHSNIFFYVKLFATIILSWISWKCILWYLLELSDSFIKNENSVLSILIEKNVEQKIYFCLSKIRFKIFKIQNFSFRTFWKKNNNWPKAGESPLYVNKTGIHRCMQIQQCQKILRERRRILHCIEESNAASWKFDCSKKKIGKYKKKLQK